MSIANATSLDVIEMDAASNNSVDDIRDLRERVAFAPVAGRHKVYILDEAHMLSTAAWNAFLKTLEEPPPHTIFVLATTEAQKVLPTVVDRCHRFDFARPERRRRSPACCGGSPTPRRSRSPTRRSALVARSATGSFRDALGTLEQLVAYSGRTIALEDVLAVLGAADADLLFGAVDASPPATPATALLAAARLADSGRDVGRFFGDLEAHVRALMVVQALGEVPAELRVTPEQDERLAEQARRSRRPTSSACSTCSPPRLRAMKDGADARTQLELALVKAAEPARDPSVKALLARLERLEARARRRRPRAARPGASRPPPPAAAASRPPRRGQPPVDDHAAGRARAPRARAQAAPTGGRRSPDRRRSPPSPSCRRRRPRVDRALARRVRRAVAGGARAARDASRRCSPRCSPRRARPRSPSQTSRSRWPESAAFFKRQADDPPTAS